MLTAANEWLRIAEVNPPTLPNSDHLLLDHAWRHVLVTDNVFGRIRVSPYAFAARITHDVPSVSPTVVVSTRDRNILAIESEVRGALGNGVESFLVVVGDTVPHVDHLADHYEIVAHLRELQEYLPSFEVGIPTRFREWQFRKRIEAGGQFFVAGPVLDPETVEPNMARLGLRPEDPPVYLMVIPPFGAGWVNQMESMGAVPARREFKADIGEIDAEDMREAAWRFAQESERRAQNAGCAGVVVMGLKFETIVDEAAAVWRSWDRA
jgi:5,10-methylenetetrahydrofolate reductase